MKILDIKSKRSQKLFVSVLNIIHYPHNLLTKKSDEVTVVDKSIKKLISDMYDTMKKNNGIGLAAVQVGVLKRIVVIEIEDLNIKLELINPKIVDFSANKTDMAEGCLSVPKHLYNVSRPEKVSVEYTDIKGKQQRIEADGLLSKCLQHEIDHLNGITIVDRGEILE